MYNILKIQKTVKKYMDSGRFEHTLGVMYTSAALAMCYQEDMEKAQVAGVLHDCAKCMPDAKKLKICKKHGIEISELEASSPYLLHGKVGAFLAKEKYGIEDEDILNAITYHTTGRPDMSKLEKIVYIADYMEPHRNKASNLTDVRNMVFKDLDLTLFKIMSDTLVYLRRSSQGMDPMTVRAYEYYKSRLLQKEKEV
ncbi:MAG: bis(5'-nucleosyl)-tetraphosphatase (symmetrical) YqeK [Eubacteriales bacterium]|nr:bis(5'-nucleosyl)-tetraphosphatase (symmetrical) YqeK [Eubacteriales bacterium]